MNKFKHIVVVSALAAIGCLAGCGNTCEDLAAKICDRAAGDLSGCAGVVAGSDQAKACERMEAVTLACRELTEQAKTANSEDQEACKADLDLIRALERQQQ
ncbi:MAG: hypothetical protein ACI9OJ_000330 [Myxococcota bacterium]|jgi:hypothetical protein